MRPLYVTVPGRNCIADFSHEAVARRDILDLTARITVRSREPKRPEINLDGDDPDTVEVVMRDGRQERAAVGIWTDAPGRGLKPEQFVSKFNECMNLAGHDGPEGLEGFVEAVQGLDTATDTKRFAAALPR